MKIGCKLFRKPALEDYISQISFKESLDNAIYFGDIPEIDVSAIEVFLHTDEVKEILAAIYSTSGQSSEIIEKKFVQIFCNIRPIETLENEEIGKKIFFIIKKDIEEFIQNKIVNGDLTAHDYKISEQLNELRCGQKQIHEILKYPDIGYVDDELSESLSLIKKRDYEEAKLKITSLLGILKQNPQQNKKTLSKAYHLLGIIYSRPPLDLKKIENAEKYLKISLRYDSQNYKANATLASLYLNKGGKENINKAYQIIKPIWDEKEKDAQILEVLLWSICLQKSSKEAIGFLESSPESQEIVRKNDILSNAAAKFYLEIDDFETAFKFIDNALTLNAQSPYNHSVKGKFFLKKGLVEDIIPSTFELVPKLKKQDYIENALKHFLNALELCDSNYDFILEQETRFDVFFCSILLNRAHENKFKAIRERIDKSTFIESERKRLEFLDSIILFNERNFFAAYNALIGLSDWEKFSYEVKLKFAKIFLKQGSPEEAKKILKTIEKEAKSKKDIQYWLDMSIIEALLGNKSGMISYLNLAKEEAKGTIHEEIVFSHGHGMLNRYIGEKEVDRVLNHLMEHDKKFPNKQLLVPIKSFDAEGKPTPEVLEFINQQKERYHRIKDLFHRMCVPTYVLEKFFTTTYAQVLSSMNDPEFWINYYSPHPSFDKEMRENFAQGKVFVFDYSSLLNLSKMGILRELERIPQKKLITKSLFDKIQYELIVYENKELRELWDYLRKSNVISIVDIDADTLKYENIAENLDKWIIDSIDLASYHEWGVVFGDDLNFLKLLKEFKIKGCITFYILDYLYENSFIDVKIRALSIGTLAERMYIFLPFDGEDLFIIVGNDDCKITLKTYHLINQITIPGVRASGYTLELPYFIDVLWKSGALFEDKKQWLLFSTYKILTVIGHCKFKAQGYEEKLLKFDLYQIWRLAINRCNSDEKLLIEKELPNLFKKEEFSDIESEIRCLLNPIAS